MAIKARPQQAKRRRPDLLTGFDSLTLDPSFRLRRTRHKLMGGQATIESAWKIVGQALVRAMLNVSRTLTRPNSASSKD
jgi:hypothetical protein